MGVLNVKDPTTGLWSPVSLMGPPGLQGATGPQGITGPTGPTAGPYALDDLSDVNLSPTGPANGDTIVWDAASGTWIPGLAGDKPPGEVWIGPDDPDTVHVGSATELWYDTNEVTIVGDEVFIGPDDPYLIDPNSTVELWFDSDAIAPPAGGATGPAGPIALNDLTDVDTTTTAPIDGQALAWNATASQWMPGGGAVTTQDISTGDPSMVADVTLITNGSYATVVVRDSGLAAGSIAAGAYATLGSLPGGLAPAADLLTYGGVDAAVGIVGTQVLIVNLNTAASLPAANKVNATLSWPIG